MRRLPGTGRDDPPPSATEGHLSGDELVTPTPSLASSSIFGNNGVPSTLNSMEMDRPHVSGETALESPSFAAENETWCSRIASEMQTGQERPIPSVPAEKAIGCFRIATEMDTGLERHSPSVAAAENETAKPCLRMATTGLESRSTSVAAEDETGCSRIANDLQTALESRSTSVAAKDETGCSRIATDVQTALERPSPSVPAEKDTGRSHVATDMETTQERPRPNPSVAPKKQTWGSRVATDMEMEIALDRASPSVAAKNRTERTHVAAETELRHRHSNASADSVLQGPRRIAHLGREQNPVCHGVRGFKTSSPAWHQSRRGKTRLDDGEPSRLGEINNTVTICLDGEDGKEVLPSYSAGITAILEYCHANGMVEDVSQLFGPEVVEVFTTPPDGTFYLVLEYNNRSLELVIGCRDLYMMGWRGPNGAYEIKSDSQHVNYMAGNDVRPVAARRNYVYISPDGDVGRTLMGIYEFRRAFDDLFNYRGGSPKTIEEAIGKIAVYISEATRLQGAFDTVCASLKSIEVSRLNKGSFNELWIQRYGHYCSEAMKHIDLRKGGKEPEPIKIRGIEIQKLEEILREIRILHIDAYDKGVFKKKEPRPKIFLEKGSKNTSHNNKRWFTEKKVRNARDPANSKHSRPPRRRFTTSSSSDSGCPQLPPLKNESSVVKPRKYSGGLTVLQKLGDEVSEFMQHFPALQRLCKQNYERHAQMQVRPSLQRLSNNGQGTQCLPELMDKLNRGLQRWDLTPPSRHPTTTCFLQRSAKAALVRSEVLAANKRRTINLGTPKTECIVTQKAPIRLAGAFICKLLRLIRR